MNPEGLEGNLRDRASLRISDGYFSGCVIGVVLKSGERIIVPVGKNISEHSIYDMASVTKAIPTACLLLRLVDEGLIGLDEKVISYIPELSIRERENILVRHLLEFTLDYSNPEYVEKGIKYKSADEILKYLFTSELKHPSGT